MMDISAMATNVNQNNASTSVSALKKAMDVEQNSVSRVLDDSLKQQQQMQVQQQQQQAVAQRTGIGMSLNITA